MRTKLLALAASMAVLSTAVALRANRGPQATTLDGVYAKAQADDAKPQFDKICAECHAFTVATKKKAEDLPLGDDPFFKKWEGKTIDELVSVIVLTMPNDGSAVVSETDALNLAAYILQQNGMPAGKAALTKESAAALLVRPKK
jgi:mono/diheme cytochrome c family protein